MTEDVLRIIDQDGHPIPRSALTKSIAAPSFVSARPPFPQHVAFGMNPFRLATILRAADQGSTLDYAVLAEEIEELYPHYSSVLSKRKRQVSQLPITVKAAEDVPDGEKHADFVRRWLDTKVLKSALYDVLDAVAKGYSVCEIDWETKPGLVRPREILYRPQRFFEVSWEDGETIWLRTDTGFEPLARHKFVLHQHKFKSGQAVRSGLTRAVAFMWMFSTYTLRDWAIFCQAYGMPVRVGRYGPEASESDKRVLWRAVSAIGGDLAAIIPNSMQVEFIEAKGEKGAQVYEGRSNWLNYEVSKLVLGGTAGTDAVNGGHAVGQEHRAAEQDVERFDADLLQNTIDRQIIAPMIAFSFGPQEAYPTIEIGRPEEAPLDAVIAGVADLAPFGLTVKAEEIRQRLQLTKPEGDDEVLRMPAMPAAGAGGAAGASPATTNPIAKEVLKIRANQHPEINPDSLTRALHARRSFGQFLTMHAATAAAPAQADFEALEARIAREATGALAGLADQVRVALQSADSLPDAVQKLQALDLNADEFAEAMARGMALAHLAGQAALLDEISSEARASGPDGK